MVVQAVEECDSLLSSGLVAMDGHGGIHYFLHTTADGSHIIEGDGAPDVEVHIVAVADRDVDGHLARVEEFVGYLTEYKEKCAGICSAATGRGDVEKLHLFLLIDAVVHAFHLIIHVSRDGSVLHLQA